MSSVSCTCISLDGATLLQAGMLSGWSGCSLGRSSYSSCAHTPRAWGQCAHLAQVVHSSQWVPQAWPSLPCLQHVLARARQRTSSPSGNIGTPAASEPLPSVSPPAAGGSPPGTVAGREHPGCWLHQFAAFKFAHSQALFQSMPQPLEAGRQDIGSQRKLHEAVSFQPAHNGKHTGFLNWQPQKPVAAQAARALRFRRCCWDITAGCQSSLSVVLTHQLLGSLQAQEEQRPAVADKTFAPWS